MSKWNSDLKWDNGVIWDTNMTYDYPRVFWGIQIDWNGDGVVDNDNEASRVVKFSTDRGREYLINSSGDGFQPVKVGKLSITLDNSDGRYDPYNTSSPLYPNVLPGRLIHVMNQDNVGTNNEIFTGYIEDIQPNSSNDQVTITAVDEADAMDKVTVEIQAGISVSDAIEAVLDAAGITGYDIDSITDALTYWWVDEGDAVDAINSLADASLGTFFIGADGVARFYKRNRTGMTPFALDQSELLSDMSIKQPWEVVKNYITLVVNPLKTQTLGTLWTLQDTLAVAAGETVEIWGSYQYDGSDCPATGVIEPVASTDYTMNTADDESGTDLTAQFTLTTDVFSKTAKFTITNNSAYTGYVFLKIRGNAVTSPDPVKIVDSDTASISAYKKRSFTMNSDWLQDTNLALSLVSVLLTLLADPRKTPTVKMQSRPEKQYKDLFERVSLTIAAKGIDGAYQVGKTKIDWQSSNGQDVITTYYLEPIIQTSGVYWEFPVEIGVDSIFSY